MVFLCFFVFYMFFVVFSKGFHVLCMFFLAEMFFFSICVSVFFLKVSMCFFSSATLFSAGAGVGGGIRNRKLQKSSKRKEPLHLVPQFPYQKKLSHFCFMLW